MGKLWKNNLFKLPVFLLAVAAICGGLLATVNYFTAPVITQNDINTRNKIYTSTFSDLYEGEEKTYTVESLEVSSDLSALGITDKVLVKANDDVAGYAYAGTVDGFVDEISFVVSFANGKYHHFQCISNKESKGNILTTLDSLITDYSVTNDTNFFETESYQGAVSGASRTDDNLIPALNACASDYQLTLGE